MFSNAQGLASAEYIRAIQGIRCNRRSCLRICELVHSRSAGPVTFGPHATAIGDPGAAAFRQLRS